jgi:hypothetical protein
MKVKELQQLLSKLDPDMEVVCYNEDADVLDDGQILHPLSIITSVSAIEAEKIRLNGTPLLKFVKSPKSETFVAFEVTTDF